MSVIRHTILAIFIRGEGFACERPAQALLYLDVARTESNEYAACFTDADCDGYQDEDPVPYTCIELTVGPSCSRALKQCVQNMSVDTGGDG